ncbi:MAG: plasmid mobilization relaxosome protein MobC [Oscillospiraceae bacterium]|nr:plasmid mobilization relaxosome protein MobC [Oscillospiraceae bacterium]
MKDRRLELRLSKREYDRLYVLAAADPDCRMKSGRPSLSAYVRRHIIWSGNDPDDLRREIRSLAYQIRKAGVNINQAVRRINADLFDGNELKEILANQRRMEDILHQIRTLVGDRTRWDEPMLTGR